MEPTPAEKQLAFYASVLVTAVEQRYASFHYTDYAWGPKDSGPVTRARANVFDRENINDHLATVASKDLHDTFLRLLAGPVKGLHDRWRAQYIAAWVLLDAGDIDAEHADYSLQLHVLGEVIYG